jgi:hypothetical protein
VITFKTFRLVKAGGRERREYAHVALPVKDKLCIDVAIVFLDQWVKVLVREGFVTGIIRPTDAEVAPFRD